MKCIATSIAAAVLLTGATLSAQEGPQEPNVEYEKLKVLKPLIGTWYLTGTNEEEGTEWEALTSIEWSTGSHKMIEWKTKFRSASSDEKLADMEWQPRGHWYYVRNNETNEIEANRVDLNTGRIVARKVRRRRIQVAADSQDLRQHKHRA